MVYCSGEANLPSPHAQLTISWSGGPAGKYNTSIFLIILKSYILNFNDVVKVLGYLIPLDRGIVKMNIRGRPTLVLVFILYYTGDIL